MLKSLKRLHLSIYILSLASGVIMTGFMMLLPLLPEYATGLGFNEFEIGLVVAAFSIGRVLFQFPIGVLSDRVGRRLIMSAALLLFAVTTAAYAMTTDVAAMIALRILQGFASSGFAVAAQSYVNDRTPSELRGLANGINSSAINIGVIAGPVLAATLSQAFTIQAPFWAGGALGMMCFLLSLAIPPLAVGKGPPPVKIPLYRLSGLKRIFTPVVNITVLSLSLVQLLQMTGLAIFITAAPILTAAALSWGSGDIALALALSGAAAAVSSPFLGRLSDMVGHLWLLGAGLAVMALQGLIVFLHPGTVITIAAFVAGGAATPAFFNAFYSLIGDATRPQERGAVTGFVGSFGEWGGIIGSALITPLAWRNIDVGAPMAVYVAVLLLTLALAIALRSPLTRPVGRL